ncbi:hypothetical protein B7P43_G11034 [Cryptotermes secundus]|uniref:RRM domain-containing protein n=1 Tax=Cryptotermes secundus TaxID=105785 RepID=A0A2J7RF85_9NEOP|nr:hypothetical protein B7P43_G11034 [Cryptotermes secundus]
MAAFLCKKNKSSASTCTTEGSTTSSSPASSVNLITTNSHISHLQRNSVTNNNNNAPKYGTLVPNRIFVGGISGSTTETELAQLFSAYGNVKATKVISDRAGVSKGYGFVTFETEEEAKRLMQDSDCIVLKERKLNIAPAIKKQPFNRTYEVASPPTIHSNTIFYQNGVPYTFHNGVAYFPATHPQHATGNTITTAGDPAATFGPPQVASAHSPASAAAAAAAAAYPVIYPCTAPPAVYMSPQQFPYQPIPFESYLQPPAPTSQYLYTASASSSSAAAPGTGPPVTQGSPMLGAPAPLPPTQHYYAAAHLNSTDLYYSVPQAYPAMNSNEGVVYEAPSQTETSSNQSAEVSAICETFRDSCSNSSNSDTVRSGGGRNYRLPPDQERTNAKCDSKLSGNCGWVAPITTAHSQPLTISQRQNASTPVVSLRKLQQMGDELDICPSKKNSFAAIEDYMTTASPQQTYYQQVPPPLPNPNKSQTPLVPVLYQSVPPMFVTSTGQPSGTVPYMNQFPPPGIVNGHSEHPGGNYPVQFQNHRAPYMSKSYTNRRGGGSSSGNQSSPMSVHIPPFPPKFHFLNNNHMSISGVNNPHIQNQKRHNRNQQYRGRDSGRYMGPNSGRLQRQCISTGTGGGIVNKNSSCAVSTSSVSAPAESSIPHITSTAIITMTTTTATTAITAATAVTSATTITDVPSPPPAPYSPMTHPVIDSTSPPQQTQFYPGTGSSAGRQSYRPPSNGMQQQLGMPQRRFFSSSRKSGNSTSNEGSTPNSANSRSSGGANEKYSKSVVNSMEVLSVAGTSSISSLIGSVDEESLGSAGDAPAVLAAPSCVPVMHEACHQMQALSL